VGGGGGATRFFSEPWMFIEMSGAMGVGTMLKDSQSRGKKYKKITKLVT